MKHSIGWIVAGMLLPLWACGGSESPGEPALTRIAFGSCASQWAEQPIFRAVVAAEPDLYLSIGDAIYGDLDGEKVFEATEESLRAEWQKLAEHPDWQFLVENVPVEATWDNHDYGHHRAGEEFSLKAVSKTLFLDFFEEPQNSERRRRPGIHQAEIHGPEGRRVQLILLDTRTFKSPPVLAPRPEWVEGSIGRYAPNENPTATLLGPEQWSWLKEQLQLPAELRIIASSGQVVADEKGMDEWGNYPHERQQLFELVGSTGASGVLLLSGNVHFAELSVTDEGPYRIFDFTSSGLTHVNEDYSMATNRHRVAGPFAGLNFGLVEINWEAEGGAVITLAAIDVEGRRAFEHRVPLESLRSGL